MPQAILAINAGSSSIKFAVYVIAGSELSLICRGILDHNAADSQFVIRNPAGEILPTETSSNPSSDLTRSLIDRVERLLGSNELAAVGHRIVHGGAHFHAPVLVDSGVMQALDGLTPLAPLHQPACLAPIRSLLSARPQLPQIACFDTAFHRDLPPIYRRLPLPLEFEKQGLCRYGFHGLSFEYIARCLKRPDGRTIVAHLGSGSSLCAIRGGRSVNTTMSLTPLDGVMMTTRSGAIDPGLVLYLVKSAQMPASAAEDLLYHKSGLLGLSGISADLRALLASKETRAREAIDQFCARAAEQIAVMATSIDGIDTLVFTGGIGQNSPEIRKNICTRLGWIGLSFDDDANAGKGETISTPESQFEVLVIPTDEESVIARHAFEIVRQHRQAQQDR
ncbi:MAG: acetate/propionate family kinase [Bradyrhizobium sp.]|uniref:acetate/propionate family kinase n=1 Tax=Bradyrhizobium sp. TaxID=376 RepID=UPI001C283EA6|nr:acetate/propionate family kinase [Bradyrhizobium sp.]MBU6462294.1 acetate/propionate family kinase [Pseudomonadota bacterium]MDE2067346.1 acetate/propionate family kinase [Bradyrhizobium sp.]MDE2242773.1 acetate/propionate family kinase [Bradyrhizobium sp.]MDE2470328.1 acetate/propionate family kinase [Bradyrhizobium sp.]